MKSRARIQLAMNACIFLTCIVLTPFSNSAGETPPQTEPKPKVVTNGKGKTKEDVKKTPPPDLSNIKAASIQIVAGDKVLFRGLSGVSRSFNPGEAIPALPCIWIIRSISDRNKDAAKSLGVKPGNSYIQHKDGKDSTTMLGVLPAGKRLRLIKAIDPAATDEQLLEEYAGMLTVNFGNSKRIPDTTKALIAALGKVDQGSGSICGPAYDLAKTNTPRAVEILIEAFKYQDPDVRKCAASALFNIKDHRNIDIEPFIAGLKDTDNEIRGNAALVLGWAKNPRGVEPLIAALNDNDFTVRQKAAMALGMIRDPRAVEPLIAVLKEIRDLEEPKGIEDPKELYELNYRRNSLMYWLIHSLGELRDPRAVEPIIAASKADMFGKRPDDMVERAARGALLKIKDPSRASDYTVDKGRNP